MGTAQQTVQAAQTTLSAAEKIAAATPARGTQAVICLQAK